MQSQEEILHHYQTELSRRGISERFSEVLANKMLDIHLTIHEETKGQHYGHVAAELQIRVLQDVIHQYVIKLHSE